MRPFSAIGRLLLLPLRGAVAGLVWLVSTLYDRLEWLYHLRVELWSVEGEERNSRLPLRVLCGLRAETKNYMLGLIFGDGYRQRSLGRFWLWNLARAIPAAAADASLVLLWTCDSHLKRFARRGDWFLLPDWVLGEVALPRDAKTTHRVRGALQKVRQQALEFQVTHDPQQFDDFYYNMYVPYTRKTFGNCAYVYSHKMLGRILRSGDLLLVEKEKKSLAGMLLDYRCPTPHLFLMGVRDGDKDTVRQGAGGAALFHFSLQYLQQQGYKKAWLGWSRPFFRDGVLEFKRRWSQVIVASRFWGFGLRVLSPTPGVRSFLRNNPFIFKRDDLLYAAVFVDAHQPLLPEQLQQMAKEYIHAGLSGLEIYRLPPEEGAVASVAAAAELPERVEIRAWPQ